MKTEILFLQIWISSRIRTAIFDLYIFIFHYDLEIKSASDLATHRPVRHYLAIFYYTEYKAEGEL